MSLSAPLPAPAPTPTPAHPHSTIAALHSLHASSAPMRHQNNDSVGRGASAAAAGTSENPLIPKRRRRTSPAELALLEEQFRINPLPSQAERARLAGRVSMTGRALQVWLQNRRQKEKKELASYHSGASALSSAGSAPDQDANTSDAGDFTFSSSPAPLRTTSSSSSVYIPLPQLGSDTASSLDTIPFLRPSVEIYGLAAPPTAPTKRSSLPDATNTSSLPSLLPPVPFPTASFAKQPQPAASLHARAQAQNMAFVHRPSGTSIIAAKKHVKKRPLGSHAPLARTPALPHAFDFPASPPQGAVVARPSLKRKGSSGSVASTTSNSSRTAPTLLMSEGGRARVWVDALGDLAASPDAIDHVREPASRRASLDTRDEVWQHMQSDLPSPSNSPAPLTRKMMRALAAESSGLDALSHAGGHADTARALSPPSFVIPAAQSNSSTRGSASSHKPSLTRKLSLSRGAEGSRAGGEETCAFSAFERKRARMTEVGSSTTTATTTASGRRPEPSRSRSTPALPHAPALISRTSSAHALPANATAATALTTSRSCVARRFSSAPFAKPSAPTSDRDSLSDGDAPFEDDDEGNSSMGELSFGSASTDTTTSSSSIVVAPARPSAALGASKTAVDEERECAELLLGLGGFF